MAAPFSKSATNIAVTAAAAAYPCTVNTPFKL